jgi:hypothetical protein
LSLIARLYSELAKFATKEIDGKKAIQLVKSIWTVGEEEGYTSERGRLAHDAAIIALHHSEYVIFQWFAYPLNCMYSIRAFLEWGQLALRYYDIELGSDSPQSEQLWQLTRQAQSNPQSITKHYLWGRREAMQVGGIGHLE